MIACRIALAAALTAAALAAKAEAAPPAPATPAPGTTTSASPATPTPTIWRLPGSAATMRVSGEDGALDFPVFVPAGNARDIKRFQLAYRAAISVMPEASWLTVEINGQTVGRVPIAAPSRQKLLSIDLPQGLLVSGWNAIRLAVTQRHRVDCTIAATYELWTEFDPARSGFVGPVPSFAALDDLPAVPVDATGAARLHVRLPKDAGADAYQRALRAVERVALRGRFAHPVVDARPGAAGLTVAIGTHADIADDPALAAAAAREKGAQIVMGEGAAPTLLIAAPTAGELDAAIDAFGRDIPDPTGSAAGLKALSSARGIRVRPGEPLALADAGIPTTAFSGRLWRASFDVVLPPDAYLGDYGEALLALDGGYAAGLARGAVFIVRVNGAVDGILSLDRSGGATFQNHVVHMPLTAFRPGRNHVELEAQLPAKADEECDTLASIGAKERFLILGTSTLTLPRLARIAQFPGLSASFVGGFRVTQAGQPQVYFPRPTPDMLSAAATLLVNSAGQTGQPTDARVVRERPKEGSEPTLVVAAAADIPGALLAAGGLDPKAVGKAWSHPARHHDETGAVGEPETREAPAGDEQDAARLDAWGERIDPESGWLGPATGAAEWLRGLATSSLRAAGLIASPPTRVTITPDTSFVITQGLLDGSALTLVTAPDEAMTASGTAAITAPEQLSRLGGKAASLTEDEADADIVLTRDTRFFPTQPFSVENYRLIAAGWLSNHAAWYIGAVLVIALLLGSSTFAALRFSRGTA
jgi:hypothetical protein